jgi:hypothetical protein
MKTLNMYKLLISFLCVLLIATSITAAAVIIKQEMDLREFENLCIQSWIELGVERKDISRNNGDCVIFENKFKYPGFTKENLKVIPVPA